MENSLGPHRDALHGVEGSSRVGARPNTLRIGCTELKAVPHASLRDPNPERSRKVLKNLEVCKKK